MARRCPPSLVVGPGRDRVGRGGEPRAGAGPRLPHHPGGVVRGARGRRVRAAATRLPPSTDAAWLVDLPRLLVGPPAPDPPAIVGLETSDGVPVSTSASSRPAANAGAGPGRRSKRSRCGPRPSATAGSPRSRPTCRPAAAGSPVYVDLTVRTPEPRWQGAVVGAWVLPQDGAEPVVLGARQVAFRSYDEYLRIPRRHPLGIAVAGRGGAQTWVMYNRSPAGDSFELAAVGRRGLRELRRSRAARRSRLATGRRAARSRRSASRCRESCRCRRCRTRARAG